MEKYRRMEEDADYKRREWIDGETYEEGERIGKGRKSKGGKRYELERWKREGGMEEGKN